MTDACWVCLKDGDEMIQPCTSCRASIHRECIRSYQNGVLSNSNICGACRSPLKPEWHLPAFKHYRFDFDRYLIRKHDDGGYHIKASIIVFEINFVFSERWILLRCLHDASNEEAAVHFVDVPPSDFVFTDDEIVSAFEEKRIVFPDERIVLHANAVLISAETMQTKLACVRRNLLKLMSLKRGDELKQASAQRRETLRRKSQRID